MSKPSRETVEPLRLNMPGRRAGVETPPATPSSAARTGYPVDTLVLAVKKGMPETDIVSGAASQHASRNRMKLPPMRRSEFTSPFTALTTPFTIAGSQEKRRFVERAPGWRLRSRGCRKGL